MKNALRLKLVSLPALITACLVMIVGGVVAVTSLNGRVGKLEGTPQPVSSARSNFVPIRTVWGTTDSGAYFMLDAERIERELACGNVSSPCLADFYEKYACSRNQEMPERMAAEVERAGGCNTWQWTQFTKDPDFLKMVADYNAAHAR